MADEWIAGEVVANHHWSDRLYSLRVAAAGVRFTAGQFGRLGLDINGERIARPYSFVNAPEDTTLEFYSIVVPDGILSQPLQQLTAGDTVWVGAQGVGFFVLDEVPASPYLWLLSTGTGIGPYLSILRTETPWQRHEKIALVHAVRYAHELAYQEMIAEIAQTHPERFVYVPVVSREAHAGALDGRIPAAIKDGRLAAATGMDFTPEKVQVMLCGNPEMVGDTSKLLRKMGLARNRRSAPGHITTESYW